ncbi:MAG: DUF3088 family protein [Bosea sp. (in: a-proteobacteria)]
MTEILFLLRSNLDVRETTGRYCPDCAVIEGVLAYHPALRQALDIRYVDFARPRQALVDLVGEGEQGCPMLLVAPSLAPEGAAVINGFGVIVETKAILDHFTAHHGAGQTLSGSIF